MAKKRRTFGKLEYSVIAKNVPEGAVRANEAHVARIAAERRAGGWDEDANVAVPGPTREASEARRRSEERFAPRKKDEGEDY